MANTRHTLLRAPLLLALLAQSHVAPQAGAFALRPQQASLARLAPHLSRDHQLLQRPLDSRASTTSASVCRNSSRRGGAGSTCMRLTMPRETPPDPDRYKKAFKNTALSIAAAVAFGAGIGYWKGGTASVEYFAGYMVEQSLSVDNLFVFILLFEYFNVPIEYQGRVLRWGIIGAVVMRGLFVALGEAALESFQPILLVFAGILLASSYKLLTEGEGGEGEEDLADNGIVKASQRVLNATSEYDGDKFFTMVDGARRATPLLLVLVCVEASDLVFAVDSIPAVFGVTKDAFIVYTSNVFAIMNLRSLYTVLSNAVGDLPYLRPAVALVLAFVGAKLGLEYFGHEVDTVLSLAVIASLLGVGVGASLVKRARDADAAGEAP